MGIIKRIFCQHYWRKDEVIQEIDDDKCVVGYKIIYICQKCGKIKVVKL